METLSHRAQLTKVFYGLLCLTLLWGCKKESRVYSEGSIFIPSEITLLKDGFLIRNDLDPVLTFPYQLNDTNNHLAGFLTYNYALGIAELESKNLHSDTSDFTVITEDDNTNLMAIASDRTKLIMVDNRPYSADKIMVLNKDFLPQKQKFLEDTISTYSFVIPIGSGKFLTQYYKYNGRTFLLCFDKQLNVQWKKEITAIPSGSSSFIEAFAVGSNFYLLQVVDNFPQKFRILMFNTDGKLLKVSPSFQPGIQTPRMVPTESGFTVLGFVYNTQKRFDLSVDQFDLNGNLVKTSYASTSDFIYSGTFLANISSRIIYADQAYYLAANITNNYDPRLKVVETRLVKINYDGSIAWHTLVDENRLPNTESLIRKTTNSIAIVGKSIWNGVKGIAIQDIDFEGKKVK